MCQHWNCKIPDSTNYISEIISTAVIVSVILIVLIIVFVAIKKGYISVPTRNNAASAADDIIEPAGVDPDPAPNATVTPRARYNRYRDHVDLGFPDVPEIAPSKVHISSKKFCSHYY